MTAPLVVPTVAEEDVATASSRAHIGRWIVVAVILLGVGRGAYFLISNDRMQWDVVWDYMFAGPIMEGLLTTLTLWAIVAVLSSFLGGLIAAAKLSSVATARWVASVYVSVFLAIPPLVQLIFWYNLAYLLPNIELSIPFGPTLGTWSTNDLITPWIAAISALTIVEAAYMGEVIRSGIMSVDVGQTDASKAVGFTSRTAFVRVVLPQALRTILPPYGTLLISLVKGTSLVSIVALTDLLRAVQDVYNDTFETIPLLVVASLWYLIIVTVLTLIRDRLEYRYSRGHRAAADPKKAAAITQHINAGGPS